jgi:hypothetical protein
MRDTNRHRRNKVARKKLLSATILENPEWGPWGFDPEEIHADWVEHVIEFSRMRERGFKPGYGHAPSDHRKCVNRTFRAKNSQVMRNLDKVDDPLFYKHIKDMDWDYF